MFWCFFVWVCLLDLANVVVDFGVCLCLCFVALRGVVWGYTGCFVILIWLGWIRWVSGLLIGGFDFWFVVVVVRFVPF